jgi:hypothetical protein
MLPARGDAWASRAQGMTTGDGRALRDAHPTEAVHEK